MGVLHGFQVVMLLYMLALVGCGGVYALEMYNEDGDTLGTLDGPNDSVGYYPAEDGGITSSSELRSARTMTDFGHPPRYTGTIRKPIENKEYLNPPVNVFMPSQSAQQVLVRQALIKGQSLGRIPDFGTNAKQFLAMGETANKAIDALKKLPHCVVGSCSGNQVMTFGGSHPEKEQDFSELQDDVQLTEDMPASEADEEMDALTTDIIQSIDLQFNEPAFEKTVLEDPVQDSPAIEPEASFYWSRPPPGLEVYPVMPPDPPPGPYSDKNDERTLPVGPGSGQKSDAAQFHEFMRQTGSGLKECIDSLDWEAIMGWVCYIMGFIIIVYVLYQLMCGLGSFEWSKLFGNCNLVSQLSEQMEGCGPFSVCDFWSCADGAQKEEQGPKQPPDEKCCGLGFLNINVCDILGSDCKGGSGGGGGGGGGRGGGRGSDQQGYVYSGMGIGGSAHGLSDEALQAYIQARYGTPAVQPTYTNYFHNPNWHMNDIHEAMRGQQPQRSSFSAPHQQLGQQQSWNIPGQQSSASIIHFTGSRNDSAVHLQQPQQQHLQRTVSFQQQPLVQQHVYSQQQQPMSYISAAGQQPPQSMAQAQAQFINQARPRNDPQPQPPQGFYNPHQPPLF